MVSVFSLVLGVAYARDHVKMVLIGKRLYTAAALVYQFGNTGIWAPVDAVIDTVHIEIRKGV